MTESSYLRLIYRIFTYFNKPQPAEEVIRAWYDKVKSVPEEALIYIASVVENCNTLPSNPPKVMLDGFAMWLNANPKRKAPDPGINTTCSDCCKGILYIANYKINDDGRGNKFKVWYRSTAYCRCGQAGYAEGRTFSRREIEEKGMFVVGPLWDPADNELPGVYPTPRGRTVMPPGNVNLDLTSYNIVQAARSYGGNVSQRRDRNPSLTEWERQAYQEAAR